MQAARKQKQSGQTLLETVVAIGILTMGLISAATLATYSFRAAQQDNDEIIGTALARQGIEAVKNIRDQNWLQDNLVDCSAQLGVGQFCYQNWLQGISPGDYDLQFKPQSKNVWKLVPTNSPYILKYDPNTNMYSS